MSIRKMAVLVAAAVALGLVAPAASAFAAARPPRALAIPTASPGAHYRDANIADATDRVSGRLAVAVTDGRRETAMASVLSGGRSVPVSFRRLGEAALLRHDGQRVTASIDHRGLVATATFRAVTPARVHRDLYDSAPIAKHYYVVINGDNDAASYTDAAIEAEIEKALQWWDTETDGEVTMDIAAVKDTTLAPLASPSACAFGSAFYQLGNEARALWPDVPWGQQNVPLIVVHKQCNGAAGVSIERATAGLANDPAPPFAEQLVVAASGTAAGNLQYLAQTVAHEIGHTLGINHSNLCLDTSCGSSDKPYNDEYTVMGGGVEAAIPALSTYQRQLLGLTTPGEVVQAGTSDLSAADGETFILRARGDVYSNGMYPQAIEYRNANGTSTYLEYRQDGIGVDSAGGGFAPFFGGSPTPVLGAAHKTVEFPAGLLLYKTSTSGDRMTRLEPMAVNATTWTAAQTAGTTRATVPGDVVRVIATAPACGLIEVQIGISTSPVAPSILNCTDAAISVPATARFDSARSGGSTTFDAYDSTGGNATTDPITSYDWDFGDGTTGTGGSPVHVYGAAGTYDVTLTVADRSGGTATVTHALWVPATDVYTPPATGYCSPVTTSAYHPANFINPIVTGAPKSGCTLSAGFPADGTYQWWYGAKPISGATSATYTLHDYDLGKTVHVVVSVGSKTYTSSSLAVPQTVLVTGSATVGQTLTASFPAQDGSFQWYHGQTPITGATSSTYTVQPGDYRANVSVRVAVGAVTYRSAATAIASNLVLTGGPTVGTPLLGTAPNGSTYQWYSAGRPVGGATSSAYTPTVADVGHNLYFTATGPDGTAYVSSKAALAGVPTVTGAAQVGAILTASFPSSDASYQWYSSGRAIAGATGTTYTLAADDLGHTVKVWATESGHVYKSAGTTLSLTPTFTGLPTVGETLTASFPLAGVTYEWMIGSGSIRASSPTLTLTAADRTRTIWLKAYYNGQWYRTAKYQVLW